MNLKPAYVVKDLSIYDMSDSHGIYTFSFVNNGNVQVASNFIFLKNFYNQHVTTVKEVRMNIKSRK